MPNSSPAVLRSKLTKVATGSDKGSASSDRPSSASSSSSTKGEGWPADKGMLKQFVAELLSDNKFLDSLVDRVVIKLNDTLDELIKARIQSEYEPRLSAMEKRIDSLEAEIQDINKKAASRSDSYERKLDAQEQYQRRNNVRIFGLPETKGENITEIVTKLCGEKLKIAVDAAQIDRCHRVGRLPGTGVTQTRPRAVIVKFVSYQTRRSVLSARRQLKGSDVTIREDLTRRRHAHFCEVAARVGIRNAWTVDGRVMWREGDRIHSTSSQPPCLCSRMTMRPR
ncbi:uncharacterized protein LOC120355240 [Nilaparvata lugens]|uniref:uncharacterized protein LOC120355240 n=1 Tax=Nilaparvata lugens TaxID=108931 RepID=UPI00193E34AB|nr:uncharacterized protein LOC120355240 [Nilaparvata lugens]